MHLSYILRVYNNCSKSFKNKMQYVLCVMWYMFSHEFNFFEEIIILNLQEPRLIPRQYKNKRTTHLTTRWNTCSSTSRSPTFDYGLVTAGWVLTCIALVCHNHSRLPVWDRPTNPRACPAVPHPIRRRWSEARNSVNSIWRSLYLVWTYLEQYTIFYNMLKQLVERNHLCLYLYW